MEQKKLNPWQWQNQLGFSQAMDVSGAQRVLYCAGQASMSADGRPLHEGNMRAQITQALDNLETVLQAAGFNLSSVIRLNYYTTDMEWFLLDFEAATTRLAEADCQPASTLLGVTRLANPKLLVEIEATAVK